MRASVCSGLLLGLGGAGFGGVSLRLGVGHLRLGCSNVGRQVSQSLLELSVVGFQRVDLARHLGTLPLHLALVAGRVSRSNSTLGEGDQRHRGHREDEEGSSSRVARSGSGHGSAVPD